MMKTAWRRVFHRYWWTLGWNNDYRGRGLTWSLCLSNFNRPIVRWSREPGCRFLVAEWGNGNSDPAVSIGWQW